MSNDVSYFKVKDDDTKYAFDDADAEVRIADESERAETAEQTNAEAISALSSATPHVITSDVIPSTDDLDNYRTNGIWRTGSTLPANCPAGFTWSQLTVTVVGTTYRQELVSGASVAVRMGNSSTWYAWGLRPTRTEIDSFGEIVSTDGDTVSLTNNTTTNLCSVSLTPGKWLIIGTCTFVANATGYRGLYLATSATDAGAGRRNQLEVAPVSGNTTHPQIVAIWNLSITTTVYLNARQTSGSALNATYPAIYACRIGLA